MYLHQVFCTVESFSSKSKAIFNSYLSYELQIDKIFERFPLPYEITGSEGAFLLKLSTKS